MSRWNKGIRTILIIMMCVCFRAAAGPVTVAYAAMQTETVQAETVQAGSQTAQMSGTETEDDGSMMILMGGGLLIILVAVVTAVATASSAIFVAGNMDVDGE